MEEAKSQTKKPEPKRQKAKKIKNQIYEKPNRRRAKETAKELKKQRQKTEKIKKTKKTKI